MYIYLNVGNCTFVTYYNLDDSLQIRYWKKKASAASRELNLGVMQDRSINADFKQALEPLWSSLGMGRDPAWVQDPGNPHFCFHV